MSLVLFQAPVDELQNSYQSNYSSARTPSNLTNVTSVIEPMSFTSGI